LQRLLQFEYQYQGANPQVKSQIPKMVMRASGIRDIANVLKVGLVTMSLTLTLWFKTQGRRKAIHLPFCVLSIS
jgi:transposase-like protein